MSERARRVQPTVTAPRRKLRAAAMTSTVVVSVLILAIVVGGADAPHETAREQLPAPALVVAEGEDPGEADEADDAQGSLPRVTYELFLARDPFQPVVPEPESNDGTDPGVDGEGSDADGDGDGDGASDGDGAGASDGGGDGAENGGCTGTTEVVCDGTVLSIVEIGEDLDGPFVVLQVDDVRYRAREGEIVGGVFEILRIESDRVLLLHGDQVVTLLVDGAALK